MHKIFRLAFLWQKRKTGKCPQLITGYCQIYKTSRAHIYNYGHNIWRIFDVWQILLPLQITYLGCILDETLSGESMAIHVINKINFRLRFLYRQNRYLSFPLCRLLCNAMIQPFFDYACNAWYPNINK